MTVVNQEESQRWRHRSHLFSNRFPFRLVPQHMAIRRTAPCTGPGGPGDLAWIWPLATWLLLPLALRRRR